MAKPMKLNKGQREAVDAIRSGANVFLTGEGGTGKSVAIKKAVNLLRHDGRKTVLCAPTGVAAQNIGGATIHSAFKFDLGPKVADALETVQPSGVIHEADTVIIDEIGMVRRDLMDAIARVVSLENTAREANPEKKRLQLVVVGDFSQLPPVVTDADKPALVEYYGPESAGTGFYAFEADGWKGMGFRVCQLTEPMRQVDPTFVEMLNRARIGDASCLGYFNKLAGRPETPSEAVSIVARNKDAESINLSRLKALRGKSEKFYGVVLNEFKKKDMAAPEVLELKKGAHVICVATDKKAGYVNGSTGVVIDMRDMYDEGGTAIVVKLDGSGEEVTVVRKTWENTTYCVIDGADGKKHLEQIVLGSYTQFPLKLSWAITYHKSQGQTLDAISLDPSTFGAGMLYVGLSRATSAAGIWLTREISPKWLKADRAVVEFYENTCGWSAPAPATGDETPNLEAVEIEPEPVEPKQPEKAPSRHRDKKKTVVSNSNTNAKPIPNGLAAIQEELHELLGSSGRAWVRVYELISRVSRDRLYKPDYKSFSAWIKAEAKREGVAESILWHRKSAGDFYNEWAGKHEDAPTLADGNRLSEDNLNLVRKIAKADPDRGDELMEGMIANGLSTKDLRQEWRETRKAQSAHKDEEDAPIERRTASASKANLSISCLDASTFAAAVAALKAAGITVELV